MAQVEDVIEHRSFFRLGNWNARLLSNGECSKAMAQSFEKVFPWGKVIVLIWLVI